MVIKVDETAYWCILGLHIFTYTVRYDVLSWDAEWNTIGNNDKKRVKAYNIKAHLSITEIHGDTVHCER